MTTSKPFCFIAGTKRACFAAALFVVTAPLAARAATECDPVDVALGKTSLADCPGLDRNGDGAVGVTEILGGGAAHPSGRGAGVVSIDVGTASGTPGTSVTFEVRLDTGGEIVVATLNDIAFDPLTPVAANLAGDPDCAVNPGIDKDVFTAFQPPLCTLGVDCTGIRVIVLALDNLAPIPTGPLYTCDVEIDAAAPAATYPLVSTHVESANLDGALPTVGTDGAVVVVAPLEHFKCYKAKDLKDPKFAQTSVALSDQFVADTAEVKKPFLLCNPVDKNGEGVSNAADHLVCYKIKTPSLALQPKVRIANQLGTLDLQAKKAFLLCVPSSKQILP